MTGDFTLRSASAELGLSPERGGRITSFRVDELELLGGMDESFIGSGCYPMVPWQGRLTDNTITFGSGKWPMPMNYEPFALHGRVLDAEWSVLERSESKAVLAVTFGGREGDPWPWQSSVRAAYTLTDDSLELGLEVTSEGERFPAELGWHPWFRREIGRGGTMQFDIGDGQMYVRGAGDILTGERVDRTDGPFDDAFDLPDGKITVTWPGALELSCETDCRYVVVFTAHPDCICIEPQTAPPDWINREPHIVAPGNALSASARWTWSRPTA